jgi:hypothetical protein
LALYSTSVLARFASIQEIPMQMAPSRRRAASRIVLAVTLVLATLGLASPTAAAETDRHVPNLVILGDSFASGKGNPPYTQESGICARSNDAYGPLLARFRVVKEQAFVACSGATTEDVAGTGPLNLPPQVDSIAQDTDVVTVQALGNDFFAGTLEAMCFSPDPQVNCETTTPLPDLPGTMFDGKTVGDLLAAIPSLGRVKLDALFSAIKAKLGSSTARVLVLGYPNLLGNGGQYCPGITTGELAVARQFVANLDDVLATMARKYGFEFVGVRQLFRGLDACGQFNAIYPVIPSGPDAPPPASKDPQGWLHPNRLGHFIYAGAVLAALYS